MKQPGNYKQEIIAVKISSRVSPGQFDEIVTIVTYKKNGNSYLYQSAQTAAFYN